MMMKVWVSHFSVVVLHFCELLCEFVVLSDVVGSFGFSDSGLYIFEQLFSLNHEFF